MMVTFDILGAFPGASVEHFVFFPLHRSSFFVLIYLFRRSERV